MNNILKRNSTICKLQAELNELQKDTVCYLCNIMFVNKSGNKIYVLLSILTLV